MTLYQEIIFLKHHFKGKWVVENVQAYYKPLIEPQPLGRHWYWANFRIENIPVKSLGLCATITKAGKQLRRKTMVELQAALGIDLSGYDIRNKSLLLRNCVEPEVGKYILDQALVYSNKQVSKNEKSTSVESDETLVEKEDTNE
jgi:DNA (cytosine-5)-methyltransferase 1